MGRAIYLSLLLLMVLGVIEAHVTYRRRPTYSFYTKDGNHNAIVNHPAHRRAARAAMPIPRRPTAAQPETTIPPATQVPSIDEFGYCQAWSQGHYRTFDGALFNFHGACTYTLVTDCLDFSFHIYVENDLDCQSERNNNTCYRSILIDNGNPTDLIYIRPGGVVSYKNEELALPTKAGGMVLERIAHYILATSGLGFSILYDGKEGITVFANSDSLRGNTCGLCGVYDHDPSNDMKTPSGTIADDAYTFGLSWKGMDERDPAYCPDVPTVPLRCTQYTSFESPEAEEKAQFVESECAQLRHGTFMACHQVVDPEPYIIACEQDVCACEMQPQENGELGNDCKCAAFTAYTQECSRRGFQVSWRSLDFCPFDCPADKVYDQCGSACTQRGCSTAIADCETDETVGCIEGCHCPTGTYRSSSGECVSANQCFCSWQGTEYEPGKQISDGCNECECVDGKWQCTQNDCGGLCQVSGHGHYHTFDSYTYDFAGACTYTLVKDCWSVGSLYMVNIENAPCGMEGASCVKAVVLEDGMNVVRLRRGHQVLINGQEVTEFPKTVGNIYVNQPTKHQTAAVMENGLTILFDGNNHVVVMADERHLNATCGLCGIYNNNQRDDFYTEAGDIESNPASFANKWKLGSSCPDAEDDATDPCDLYSQKALTAELECNRLYTDDAFAVCRRYVDPEVFFEACRRDICNCETGDSCKCEIFAMFATQCEQKGVVVDWRTDTPGCGISCEGGLVYSRCHPMCETTCNALSSNSVCDETCVEGCACPDGSVMSPSGACVAPENCGCVDPDSGETYAPGERIEKGCGFCECFAGTWACEELDCPADACLQNQVYVPCVSPCVKSCTNMHEFEDCSAATCFGGCECAEEFVWDGAACVLPTSCPCHHGGYSYSEGFVLQTDECHSCTCTNSKWECHEKNCNGVCTAWGDPHYKTFDGRLFDFQGDCDYVLVTDSVSQASGVPFFHIVVSNIPCGTSAVTCTKSITFSLGVGNNQEKLHLIRGKSIPDSAGSFTVTEVGRYVYVHTNQRITLIWDQGTWIQVKLDPMYKDRVGGLCGNFNDLISDDFLSPAGGLPETSSIDFGNSWKVHDYCPRPQHVIHPCLNNPFRRAWAMRQCSVLKSDTFAPCHSEVSFRPFYVRCIFDTCGCDTGGDCECLCTAIAAYAQECNAHGVHIHWRSNEFCPMQCDGCAEYDPCIPVCSICGHEGRWDENGECPDTCVEGCKCPDGQYYHDGECVDACPTTTPPVTTPYISTTPPWVSTTGPTTTPTSPTTSPHTHTHTSTEITTTETPETTTTVPSTTKPPFTFPPYTPPYNTCYCHGYGDPHYSDFNGNEFDHQGNCTYILSEDTSHSPPLYTVLIHNVECKRFPGTTCPKELSVIYSIFHIRLLSAFYYDGSHMVSVNDVNYIPPLNFSGIEITSVGFYLILKIPLIGLEVRFIPLDNNYFSVEVPRERFFNLTDGLCGNCGHNETTCEEDSNCCDLIPPEYSKDCGCDEIITPCPPTDGSREWCNHLYDPVFEDCHAVIDPAPYVRKCIYDNCFANGTTCFAFEAYATLCANQGVCLEWRSDDLCPMDCVEPFEYRQCVCPDDEHPSCKLFDPGEMMCGTEPVSGCFCPEGNMPVSNDTCVPCPSTTPIYTTSEYFSTTQKQTFFTTTSETTFETTSQTTSTNSPTTIPTTTIGVTTESITTKNPTTTIASTTPTLTTTEGLTTLPETTKSEITTEATTENISTTNPTTLASTTPTLTTTESLTTLPETTKSATTAETTTENVSTTNPMTTMESTTPTLTTTESLTTLPETTKSATTAETTTENVSTTNPTTTMESTTPTLTTTEGLTTLPETTKSATTAETTTENVSTTNPMTTMESTTPTLTTTESLTTLPETTKSATTAETTTENVSTTNPTTTMESTTPTLTTTEGLTTLPETTKSATTNEATTIASTKPTTMFETTAEESTSATTESLETTTEFSTTPTTSLPTTMPQETTFYETTTEITSETTETTEERTTSSETTTRETTTGEETTESGIATSLPTTSSHSSSPLATTTTTPLQTKEMSTHLPFETTPMETTKEGLTTKMVTESQTTSQTTREETTAEETTESATTSETVSTVETTAGEATTTSESGTTSPLSTTKVGSTGVTTDQTMETTSVSYTSEETTAAATTMATTSQTTIMTSSATPTIPTTPTVPTTPVITTPPETTTGECDTVEVCEWTSWCDDEAQTGDKITGGDGGEYELIETCRELNHDVCKAPIDIECETAFPPHYTAQELGQSLTCDKDTGLECLFSEEQPLCFDYRIRFLCCRNVVSDPNCLTTSSTAPPTTLETTTTSTKPTETVTTTSTTKTIRTTNSGVKNPTLPAVTYPTHSSCGTVQGKAPTIISYNNCTSPDPIYLNECQGKCSSSHSFTQIIDGQMIMDQYCSCCRPESIIEDVVELECPDGTTTSINVPFIQSCICNEVEC
ncbi:mucin-2-like isoform X2 [Lytechinus variegatus]|uniref:mucin-2-like isoform X2 n=1 Tax=Lytechinus variegatus TaxID=7654 RepID=UPI001BB11D5D|nr:mucin-2-like isoform X2 [Lytechinus variegatus]